MSDNKQDERNEEVRLEDLPVEESKQDEVKGGPCVPYLIDLPL